MRSHAGTSGNIKGGSVPLGASKPCTYTSWLMLHGTHNYSREVESMPLYRNFSYQAPLKDIVCTPLHCRVTIPLLKQFGWIYSAMAHTTCMHPVVNGTAPPGHNGYAISMDKPNEFQIQLDEAGTGTIPAIDERTSFIQTGTTCTTSCVTGLGGEDIVFTCVGVARIFPGVAGTIDEKRIPEDDESGLGGNFGLGCTTQEYCYEPIL